MHRPTQTHDDALAESVASDPSNSDAYRLILFFRADAPTRDAQEFLLQDNPAWTVGRIDSGHGTGSVDAARIFSRDDILMSARHAIMRKRNGRWEIEDAGSKNGTFVNGVRLARALALNDRDVIECGNSFFLFRGPVAHRSPPGPTLGRVGRDTALSMPPLYYQIASILPFANSDLGLHLHGETGAGKDVVARAVHDLSGRRGRFVARNCAAIPDTLFESELFGYRKGAFSGAVSDRRGQLLEAQQGTLFLDEIGELSLAMQAKLLRVLELKEVLPIGATTPVQVDFRLISATLVDLRMMVEQGRFRKDLYGRLGLTSVIPPLREHKEAVGTLVPALLAAIPVPGRRSLTDIRFTIAAARAFVHYSWPFNIRELKQCLQSAVMAAAAEISEAGPLNIHLTHLPDSVSSALERKLPDEGPIAPRPRPVLKRLPTSPSDTELLAALQEAAGNRADAARALGVSERTVFRRLRKLRPEGLSSHHNLQTADSVNNLLQLPAPGHRSKLRTTEAHDELSESGTTK